MKSSFFKGNDNFLVLSRNISIGVTVIRFYQNQIFHHFPTLTA